MEKSVDYLGYKILNDGIRTDPDQVKAVMRMKQ